MHRGVPIPQEFWKVVTVVDSVGKLYSAAFIVSQSKWATNIPFEVWPTNDFNNFQVTVKKIQEVTGLLFDEQVLNSDVRFGATNKKPLKSLNDLEMIKRK
jgi:endonuclease G